MPFKAFSEWRLVWDSSSAQPWEVCAFTSVVYLQVMYLLHATPDSASLLSPWYETGLLSEINYTLPSVVASVMFVFDFVMAYFFLPSESLLAEGEKSGGCEDGEVDVDVEKGKESYSDVEDKRKAEGSKQRFHSAIGIKRYLEWVLYLFKDFQILFLITASFTSSLVCSLWSMPSLPSLPIISRTMVNNLPLLLN